MISTRTLVLLVRLLFCICVANSETIGQVEPKKYLDEIAAASHEVIETDNFRIQKLDLGPVVVGKNGFSAVVKNKSGVPLTLGLDLRAQPGLWFRSWQNQFAYQIGPGEETDIHASYQFPRMTEEASLRIRFGVPSIKNGGGIEITSIFFEKRYYIGNGNNAVDYDLSHFEQYTTDHFEIYSFRGSLASKQIHEIARQRESGLQAISELLDTTCYSKIRLFFYPDAQTKKKETGHTGEGWAILNNIIEVYNEETKLDPFHEVAHIIARQLGEPPALFNEGFATYSSERMGADALKYLGSPGKKIDETVSRYFKEKKLIPLDTLFYYTDIGPEESKPALSYPEAVSFVKFLLDTYGKDKFRLAYRTLKNDDDPDVVSKNRQAFKQIYDMSVSDMEQEWLKKFR